ncbi:Kinesin-related motor protein [Rhizina undulata]
MAGTRPTRKSNASALQSNMRPPSTRPASRNGNISQQSSYLSAARMGAGTSNSHYSNINNIASSPANSVSSRTRHGGNQSPIDTRSKRKVKDDSTKREEDDAETNITVVVRCRGRSEREVKENSGVVLSTPGGVRGKEVALSMGPLALSNKTYTFDRVFGPEADQAMIYDDVVAPILEEMLSGYNCTIFAYGQTGTGKTYTMSGNMTDNFGTYSDSAGIIPRTLYRLFTRLDSDDADNSVKCSFIELYNEELKDLLAADEHAKVKIFEDSTRKGGIVIQGMEESYIKNAEDGVKLLQEGSHKRQVAATRCNDLSSRSHTVFTITVHVKDIGEDGEEMLRTGKLNLVDLAGSENIGRSGAENKRAREAGMINQSLLTLGRVINALVDKSPHIPYRESKLTRLLQDSLGGRTKTCIIATVSPAKSNLEETISTLDYAARAKDIRNKPQINQMLTKKALIREYVIEIEKLKGDLLATRQKNGVFLTQESFSAMSEESESRRILIEEQQRKVEVLETAVRNTREQFEQNMRLLLDVRKELEGTKGILEETRGELKKTETDLSKTRQNLVEETVLRKAHEHTEEKLDTIGHGLISTLAETVRDVGGLHSKIGRMADLEVINHSTWTRSSNKVTDVTEMVESEIENFMEEQQKIMEAVSSRMSGFVDDEAKKLEAAYKFLESKLEGFDVVEHELSSETKKSKDDMNQVLEEIKTLREEVKQRIGDGLKGLNDAAQRIAAEVVEDLAKFGLEIHASYSQLGKDCRSIFDEVQKHIISQKAEVEKLRVQLASATNAAASASTTAKSTLDTILAEERKRATDDRQSLITQITALINSTADEQDKRLTKRVKLVQDDMDIAKDELETAAKEYASGMDVWSEQEEVFSNELVVQREELKKKLVDDWRNAEKHNAKIQATTQAIHAETVRLVDAQTQDVGVQMQALDSFVTRARSQNEGHHETFLANLATLSSSVRSSYTHVSNELSTLKTDVASVGATILEETSKTQESLEPFSLSTRQPLANLRKAIEDAPLKEYIPTGETPRKRDYEYPFELPRTAAHEELLAKLRHKSRTPLGEKEVASPNVVEMDVADNNDPVGGKGFFGKVSEREVSEDIEDDDVGVLMPPSKKTRSMKITGSKSVAAYLQARERENSIPVFNGNRKRNRPEG